MFAVLSFYEINQSHASKLLLISCNDQEEFSFFYITCILFWFCFILPPLLKQQRLTTATMEKGRIASLRAEKAGLLLAWQTAVPGFVRKL